MEQNPQNQNNIILYSPTETPSNFVLRPEDAKSVKSQGSSNLKQPVIQEKNKNQFSGKEAQSVPQGKYYLMTDEFRYLLREGLRDRKYEVCMDQINEKADNNHSKQNSAKRKKIFDRKIQKENQLDYLYPTLVNRNTSIKNLSLVDQDSRQKKNSLNNINFKQQIKQSLKSETFIKNQELQCLLSKAVNDIVETKQIEERFYDTDLESDSQSNKIHKHNTADWLKQKPIQQKQTVEYLSLQSHPVKSNQKQLNSSFSESFSVKIMSWVKNTDIGSKAFPFLLVAVGVLLIVLQAIK